MNYDMLDLLISMNVIEKLIDSSFTKIVEGAKLCYGSFGLHKGDIKWKIEINNLNHNIVYTVAYFVFDVRRYGYMTYNLDNLDSFQNILDEKDIRIKIAGKAINKKFISIAEVIGYARDKLMYAIPVSNPYELLESE